MGIKIVSVVGARPQFIKLAPLCHSLRTKFKSINHIIVHTGQHYDYNMSKIFFQNLRLPEPNFHLNVGSGTHGKQTGRILEAVEAVLLKVRPDIVLVFGDTNSTLAGALAAKKLNIPVAHVEAGLRSYNRDMPEETNRIVADHCSDILFCPTKTAVFNLKKEGLFHIINGGKLIHQQNRLRLRKTAPCILNVGDIMYDALNMSLKIAAHQSNILKKLRISRREYHLATIHRAENTDSKKNLSNIVAALSEISQELPVIFPIHPRTRKQLNKFRIPITTSQLRLIEPVGYFDMLLLEKNAGVILTDSGGIQKEAYWLQVPCVTLREETEWVETVKSRWNIIGSTTISRILTAFNVAHRRKVFSRRQTAFGKGCASIEILKNLLQLPRRIT